MLRTPLEAFIRAAWPEWDTYTAHMQTALMAAAERGLTAYEAAQWRPIATAPKNEATVVLVYAAAIEDLPAFQTYCTWHPDAEWCVDELRPVTHWRPLPPHPKEN
jgi:hypothetical protein